MVARVEITDAAGELLDRLKQAHGPLMFHQSGGCCDGSAPMCYPVGDFRVGPQDVLLGRDRRLRLLYRRRTVRLLGAHPARRRRGAGARRWLLGRGAGGLPVPDPQPRLHRRRGGRACGSCGATTGGMTAAKRIEPQGQSLTYSEADLTRFSEHDPVRAATRFETDVAKTGCVSWARRFSHPWTARASRVSVARQRQFGSE